ncbi:MAG: hypothetical protein P8Y44_03495, partial [Acidobacteriota bacterium]
MDSSSTPSLNKLHWEEVLPPAGKIGSESLYLNRLLQYLCQENALYGAALYIETDEGLRRQASCGRDDYPMMLAADADPPDPHFKLPAGLLVYASEASAPVDLTGPWALALTSAQQATVLGRHLKQQSFVVNYRGVELEALYDVGLAIASMLNLEGLGEEALLRAVSLLDARRGALYLRDGKRFVLDHTFGGEAAAELPLDDPQIQRLLE